jgi:hypothetical protein
VAGRHPDDLAVGVGRLGEGTARDAVDEYRLTFLRPATTVMRPHLHRSIKPEWLSAVLRSGAANTGVLVDLLC